MCQVVTCYILRGNGASVSMYPIKGYKVTEKVGETPGSVIFRGIKEGAQDKVILKLLKARFPSPGEIARLKHEFAIIRKIKSDHIIKTYEMFNHGDGFVLVLEDIHGISINRYLKQHSVFDIKSFLDVAIKICSALIDLHNINLVHKDIKPGNILLNTDEGIIKVTDFGLSDLMLANLSHSIRRLDVHGTLLYISPEQTGRMNLSIDHRSDLYSLGATFYKMLTGYPPFRFDDALELIHSHIARKPEPLTAIRPEIPEVLSNIVLKLLSKNPEDRYQSGFGLIADLEKCCKNLMKSKRIASFKLGKKDISSKFMIPHTLVGREDEVGTLINAFNRISQTASKASDSYEKHRNSVEMVFVSGEPGIGKSALINELNKHLHHNKCLYVTGKYEQFAGDAPYSAIISGLQNLMQRILAESDDKIFEIKEKLLTALGKNGKLILDIIPELEKIIGPQPDVKALEPNEAKNRFHNIFERFIGVFTTQSQPFVFFLDDLQWADMASLHLIKKMIGRKKGFLFFVGTYRSNEVHMAHPLRQLILEIQNDGILPTQIELGPLDEYKITKLIINFLNCSKILGAELANAIYEKTGGNPFFIRIFLYALKRNDLLGINAKGKWSWDIEKIREMNITDNVVELLSEKMTQLTVQEQDVLKIGACIGNRFDLDTLSNVTEFELDDLLPAIDEIMEQGFISLSRNQYRFHHDRIREAAYALIPHAQKAKLHYKIGYLSLYSIKSGPKSADTFFIADQLNLGIDLITDVNEREALVQMNFNCGIKARNSAAFLPALNYFETAIRLLDSDCWEKDYNLSLLLYSNAAEAACLASEYDKMNRMAHSVLFSARNVLDTIAVYSTLIRADTAQSNFTQAVQTILEVLKQLQFPVPENPGKFKIALALLQIKPALTAKKIHTLIDLPEVKDEQLLAIFLMLSHLSQLSFVVSPELFAYTTIKSAQLSLKHGNCENNAAAYIGMAILFINTLNDIETGHRLGCLSLALVEKYNAKSHEARVLTLFNMMVGHWKMDSTSLLREYTKAYYLSIENGDLESAAQSLLLRDGISLLTGGNLSKLETQVLETCRTMRSLNQLQTLNLNYIIRRNVLAFLDEEETDVEAEKDVPSEEEIIAIWESENASVYLGIYYTYRLLSNYYHGEFASGLINFESAIVHEQSLSSLIAIKDLYFYGTLTLLALYPKASKSQKRKTRKHLKQCMKKFKKWARSAPMNNEYRIKLIEAEWARVSGKDINAQNGYDCAIAMAKESGYEVEAALCSERAGDYYAALGRQKIAEVYWSDAYDAYSIWGAVSKQKQMRQAHPYLIHVSRTSGNDDYTAGETSTAKITESPNQAIDLTTVIKASQTISGERKLGRLLEKMMEITIENAGAQKGFLILENNRQLLVEAEKNIDKKEIQVLKSIPASTHEGLSVSILNYVARSHKTLILSDAANEGDFVRDPYIQKHKPKSILCAPIINQGNFIGLIYLENNLSAGAFSSDRMELINILSSQIAISIENAKFYQELEEKVRERTRQLKDVNEKLRDLSYIDPLTNLHNRRYLYEFVSEVSDNFLKTLLRKLHRKDRRDQSPDDKIFGVYLLDIDHFKSVNDTYGHQAGDAVLVAFSDVLKGMIRSDDILVRWGGEEFLIILQNIKRDYLTVFPQKVIKAVSQAQLPLPNNQTISKTCSIGYAQMPFHFCQPDLLSLEQTINLSDFALYMAKENGRNQAVCIELNMKTPMDAQFKHYLFNLSKNSKLKKEYIQIRQQTSA